jgi:putative ABC transport system permease protein
VEPGFTPDGAFQARVSIPPSYRTPDEVSRFYERLSERLGASPGVAQVGVISVAPLSGLLRTIPFSVQGQSTAERDRVMANLRTISPGYLEAVGTRLVRGRRFADTDRSNTPPVALVSVALADRLLSERGIGQQLLIPDNTGGQRPLEIVGVVDNVRHAALDRPGALDIYVPLRQIHADEVSSLRETQFWIVRTAVDPAAFRGTFLEHLRSVDPDAAVSNPGAMRQLVDDSLGPRRFNLTLFGAFAATAVMLAVVGLHSLVSYAVSQRAREIGLRMALGASQGDVQRMILRQATTLGLLGVGVGVVVAGAGVPLLSSMIPDLVIPTVMAGSATALLFTVVLMAAWWPARRAAKTEPTVALKLL